MDTGPLPIVPVISSDDWTEEQCVQLIREYRNQPMLWDPKHPQFYKKVIKSKCWARIGRKFEINPDSCRQKMVILLSSFRREKAKIMNSIKDGDTSNMYKSIWFGFKELAFLLDKDGERNNQQKETDTPNTEGEVSLRDKIMMHHFQPMRKKHKKANKRTHSVLESPSSYIPQNLPSNSAMKELVQKPQLTVMPMPAETKTSECEEEIKSFTNFIAMKMRKYTEETKNAVQQAICEIIFKADQNVIDTNSGNVIYAPIPSKQDSVLKTVSIEEDEDSNIIVIKQDYSESD